MPSVTESVRTQPFRRCGRCREEFPLELGAEDRTASDWWLCVPCHAILLPNRTT